MKYAYFMVYLITLIYYIIKTTHLYATFLYSVRCRNNFGPSVLRERVRSLNGGGRAARVPARPLQAPVDLKTAPRVITPRVEFFRYFAYRLIGDVWFFGNLPEIVLLGFLVEVLLVLDTGRLVHLYEAVNRSPFCN